MARRADPGGRARSLLPLAPGAALLVGALACAGSDPAAPALFRTLRGPLTVAQSTPRAGYLDAALASEGVGFQVFAEDTPVCRSVLAPGAEVRYKAGLMGGSFERNDERCDSAGIGSLAFWRDRRPRTPGPPVPRKAASFRRIAHDDELIFVRGRFPLAYEVGWSGGEDSVAALPNTPQCRARAAEGVASLEFRPSGPEALILVTDQGPCPLLGLMRPIVPPR